MINPDGLDLTPFLQIPSDDQICRHGQGGIDRQADWTVIFSAGNNVSSVVVAVYEEPAFTGQTTLLGVWSGAGATPRSGQSDFQRSISFKRSGGSLHAIAAFVNTGQWQALFRWPNDGHNNSTPQFGDVKGEPVFRATVFTDDQCMQ